MILPKRIKHNSRRADKERRYPGHAAWVRGHGCCVPGCKPDQLDPLTTVIEAAHVRRNTDGGTALKPHDKWTISLCVKHHREQHRADLTFEAKYGIDTRELAIAFARRSPHRRKWEALECA
jgi:hypothetical protein